jgi:hypothetical protein
MEKQAEIERIEDAVIASVFRSLSRIRCTRWRSHIDIVRRKITARANAA